MKFHTLCVWFGGNDNIGAGLIEKLWFQEEKRTRQAM